MIKPQALQVGDRVVVISPASPSDPDALQEGVQVLKDWGLDVIVPDFPETSLPASFSYLAGNDEQRLAQIHDAFCDRRVKGIFCARGGYGSMRLIAALKPEILSQNPKVFVGYSDLTALLNFLTVRYSLVTFHGPVVAKDLDRIERPKTAAWLKRALMQTEPLGEINPRDFGADPLTISPGSAKGILVGGNLSLLAATLGTELEVNTDGKILFIEDRGEKLYRLDRLFTQLKLAQKFAKVAGILLGEFTECEELNDQGALDIIKDIFQDVSCPVLYGFPAGHCDEKVTLPLGVSALLDADQGTLNISEAGVQ